MKHCSLAKIFFLIRRMSWFGACPDSLKRWRTLWSPSQLVQHTNKNRAVFNYSSQNQGKKLNTVLWKKSWSFPEPKWFCRLRPWIRLFFGFYGEIFWWKKHPEWQVLQSETTHSPCCPKQVLCEQSHSTFVITANQESLFVRWWKSNFMWATVSRREKV